MSHWEIRIGDSLELLRAMPEASVQCVVTSPPYWGLRDYGVAGQIGLEPTPEAYVSRLVELFREVRRVLRDDGTLWLNLGDTYASGGGTGEQGSRGQRFDRRHTQERLRLDDRLGGLKPKDLVGIPWRVAFALQADGWWLRSDVIWAKPNPMPESVTDRPTKAHEYVFLLAKAERYYYDAEAIKEPSVDPPGVGRGGSLARVGNDPFIAQNAHRGEPPVSSGFRNRRSVWTVATQPFAEAHFATFPEALVDPCVLAGTSPQACEKCGAPWERIVERAERPEVRRNKRDGDGDRAIGIVYQQWLAENPPHTTGWRSSCSCENTGSADCLVLDPFAGSGTVGVVSLRHGRRFLGLELNPTYAAMARRRIAGPLFAETSA